MSILKEIAIKKAKQSICEIKVSAIGLDKKGNYLGIATNYHRFNKKNGGIHAEIKLIRRYKGNIKTIIICRINKSGKVLPIDPCDNCKKVAGKYGIKIVSIQNIK